LLLALLGEQVWQLRAERAALTQAHQRIQIGDTAEQACLVLQAVQLFTVLPNAQDRCAHMGLTGTTFSGNWHLLIRIENQSVVGKAIRDFGSSGVAKALRANLRLNSILQYASFPFDF